MIVARPARMVDVEQLSLVSRRPCWGGRTGPYSVKHIDSSSTATIQPTALAILPELRLKLDTPDLELDFMALRSADVTGRARALGSMVQAGIAPEARPGDRRAHRRLSRLIAARAPALAVSTSALRSNSSRARRPMLLDISPALVSTALSSTRETPDGRAAHVVLDTLDTVLTAC